MPLLPVPPTALSSFSPPASWFSILKVHLPVWEMSAATARLRTTTAPPPAQNQGCILHETCYQCFLPQTLCREQLHDKTTEYGTAACPWKNLTLGVLILWRRGRLTNPATGITQRDTFKDVVSKLWLAPDAGDLLPLGVRLIVEAHRK